MNRGEPEEGTETGMPRTQRLAEIIATFGYIGKAPFAPGTFGSIAAVIPCLIMGLLPVAVAGILLVGALAAAAWSADVTARQWGADDPGAIVVDEVVGMMVSLLGHPLSWPVVLGGLALFRLFDILKPFPVGWLDKRLKGGVGIVADDVAAGIMASAVLWLVRWLLG